MSFTDMGRGSRLLHRVALNGLASRSYRGLVQSIGLRGDERVLDFGSGSGAAARHIAPLLQAKGGRLTCVDISPAWLAEVKKALRAYSNVEYRLGHLWDLDLPPASFDVVLVNYVLHDIPRAERARIVAELAHVLRPEGRLISGEPTGAGHGMTAAELDELFFGAGLEAERSWQGELFRRPYVATAYRHGQAVSAAGTATPEVQQERSTKGAI